MGAGHGWLLIAAMLPAAIAHAETRSYAVNWFHLATYRSDGDCPEGLNPTSHEITEDVLIAAGSKVRVQNNVDQESSRAEFLPLLKMRGRVDGKPVSAWDEPTSVPDPGMKTVQSKVAIGFDLDGNAQTGGFVDPETGVAGVDNQLYRALGCFIGYHTRLPGRPAWESSVWTWVRDTAPPWVVTISGEDLSRDTDVTVTFELASNPGLVNQHGDYVADQTFLVSPDRQSVQARGRIRRGTLTLDRFDLSIRGDGTFVPELKLSRTQMRMQMADLRSPSGFIGGYTPWLDYWFMYHQNAPAVEPTEGINVPGAYYVLRRMADADPDPGTGYNRLISAAFRIELVPVLFVRSIAGSDASKPVALR